MVGLALQVAVAVAFEARLLAFVVVGSAVVIEVVAMLVLVVLVVVVAVSVVAALLIACDGLWKVFLFLFRHLLWYCHRCRSSHSWGQEEALGHPL